MKVKENKKLAALLLMDVEKAFDAVWHNGLLKKLFFFFFIFYSFFFQKQVKVLHEANIQKRSNIDILINTVKKRVYRQNRKTICILIIWSCILIQNLPNTIIVDDKS